MSPGPPLLTEPRQTCRAQSGRHLVTWVVRRNPELLALCGFPPPTAIRPRRPIWRPPFFPSLNKVHSSACIPRNTKWLMGGGAGGHLTELISPTGSHHSPLERELDLHTHTYTHMHVHTLFFAKTHTHLLSLQERERKIHPENPPQVPVGFQG